MVITVYAWDDAPEELQALSGHGGDEDWVVVVPPEYLFMPQRGALGTLFMCEYYPNDSGRDYVPGWGWVERHESAGNVVFITAHA